MIIKVACIFILEISLHYFSPWNICVWFCLFVVFCVLFFPWFPPFQSQKICLTGRYPASPTAGCSLGAAALQPVGSPASQRRSAKSIPQVEEAPRGWLMAGRSCMHTGGLLARIKLLLMAQGIASFHNKKGSFCYVTHCSLALALGEAVKDPYPRMALDILVPAAHQKSFSMPKGSGSLTHIQAGSFDRRTIL